MQDNNPFGETDVSIPFSTIKRMLREKMGWRFRKVSIPFSTIKSMKTFEELKGMTQFQFHLVRLKAKGGQGDDPAGTWFQFHLVRLKARWRET